MRNGQTAAWKPQNSHGDRSADDRSDEEHDDRERLGVARPRKQQIPDRVDDSRAERENESLGGQVYARIAAASTGR